MYTTQDYLRKFGLSDKAIELGEKYEKELEERFKKIDETAEYNQLKVIKAMQDNRLSDIHFASSTGYGGQELRLRGKSSHVRCAFPFIGRIYLKAC